MSNEKLKETYNAFPYESLAVKQSHPQHLFAIASLYGFNPIPVENARILELGCASGGNIIPIALHYPQALFVGIDLAENQIAMGLNQIADLNLDNIQLMTQSIEDFSDNQTYDYIICHGLYSWVPEQVRKKVLAICQKYLSEKGIAYISYNTYPGWRVGDIVRDLMLTTTKEIDSLQAKVDVARHTLMKLKNSLTNDSSAYTQLLNQEIDLIMQSPDNQLLHEHLTDYHYPLYFSEFISQAKAYNLTYISDAYLSNDYINDNVDASLSKIEKLQMMDFINNQRFRCSLLCHQRSEANITKSPAIPYDASENFNFQYSFKDNKNTSLSDNPIACRLARYQATIQDTVINHHHENILLTPVAQMLLPYLDGTHTIKDLQDFIFSQIEQGELSIVNSHGEYIQDQALRYKETATICLETLSLLVNKKLMA